MALYASGDCRTLSNLLSFVALSANSWTNYSQSSSRAMRSTSATHDSALF
jgi:hypothetical protein